MSHPAGLGRAKKPAVFGGLFLGIEGREGYGR
jgi:hypothetical protein